MDWPQLIPVLLALALVVPLPSFADQNPTPTERTRETVPPPGVFPSDVEARGQMQPEPEHEYVVRKGDTLSAIAERIFGDERQWTVIARANAIEDPKALRVGQRLAIPARPPKSERADPGEDVRE